MLGAVMSGLSVWRTAVGREEGESRVLGSEPFRPRNGVDFVLCDILI